MRVALRTDASQAIGWGHLKRCLALAQALREQGAAICFFVRRVDLDAAALVRAAGFEAVTLADGLGHDRADDLGDDRADDRGGARAAPPHAHWLAVSAAADAAAFCAAAGAWHAERVVVDHYALDARWHDAVRTALGLPIVVIDDLADRPLSPDLLLDHNPADDAVAKYRPVLKRPARLCSGGAYALLDSVYAEHAPLPWRDEVRSIGIFMGGSDAADFSGWAWHACRAQAGWQGAIEIATTSANPNLGALRELAAVDAGLALLLDQPHLADFHARHDIQLGAGGGALWERCALGVPTIAVVTAPNQRLSVPLLARDGVVLGLDAVARSDAQCAELGGLLRRLLAAPAERRALRERARALIDGRGAGRAAAAVLKAPASSRNPMESP